MENSCSCLGCIYNDEGYCVYDISELKVSSAMACLDDVDYFED